MRHLSGVQSSRRSVPQQTSPLQFLTEGPTEGVALQELPDRADQARQLMACPEQAEGDAEPAHGCGLATNDGARAGLL